MNKKKVFFPVLFFSLIFSISFTAFAASGDGCDGCKRFAVLKDVTGNLDLNSFRSHLIALATSPCFSLLYSGATTELGAPSKGELGERPTEYYFTASYETNMEGRIKSRLSLDLYFEDGELIHNWKTESERPTVTFRWHRRNMFTNPSAVFKKWVPLDITLLNDFEKQPHKCDIKPEKEELFPGQQMEVKISNIVDFEGRKSREFNRIVIQAEKGKIIGGTSLLSDPDLKAFQVGKEDMTFTYAAPDEENSQAAEDKIIVYNSCDILRKDEYPMPKTGLKDKIAEKTIKLAHADAMMTISQKLVQNLPGSEINWKAKENVVLKYKDTLSFEDEGTFTEYYDVKSWTLTDVKATITDSEKGKTWKTQQTEKEDKPPGSLSITFNSKTGKATEVGIPGLSFWFLFHNALKTMLPGTTFGFPTDVKSGDGIHSISGEGTQVYGGVTYEQKWEIKRYRKK